MSFERGEMAAAQQVLRRPRRRACVWIATILWMSEPRSLLLVVSTPGSSAARRWNHSSNYPHNWWRREARRRRSTPPHNSAVQVGSQVIRGGGGSSNFISASSVPSPPVLSSHQPTEQLYQQQQYSADGSDSNSYAVYEPAPMEEDLGYVPTNTVDENMDPFHETVQDRVDQWRSQLQENAAQLQQSPRDDKGRLKLLTSVGKGSRTFMFALLLMRDLSLYEAASELKFGSIFVCTPLMALFVGNLVGAVVSLMSAPSSHTAKKRLKAILNLDKLVEIFLLGWYLLRLTVWPAQYIPREVYVGRLFHALFFLFQAHAITRLSWDETVGQPVSSYTTNAAAYHNNAQPQYDNIHNLPPPQAIPMPPAQQQQQSVPIQDWQSTNPRQPNF